MATYATLVFRANVLPFTSIRSPLGPKLSHNSPQAFQSSSLGFGFWILETKGSISWCVMRVSS